MPSCWCAGRSLAVVLAHDGKLIPSERFSAVKIAYLMNTYPLTSTTFIRREIEALERLGLTIHRHAVRMWTGRLVDPRDIAETGRTHYLLAGNIVQLLAALPRELFSNPRGLLRALRVLVELVSNARG